MQEKIEDMLHTYMRRFEQENRGNRVSLELLQGMSLTLNMLITDITQIIEKVPSVQE